MSFFNNARLRIGTAIRTIPEEYKTFFTSKKVLTESIYDPKLKLFLHLNGTLQIPKTKDSTPEATTVLVAEGAKEVENFLGRLRFLMKWGHFYWRLSDLSALKLEPQRVIKPDRFEDDEDTEMKIYWQMKVKGDSYFINDHVNWKSLCQVQYHRYQRYQIYQRFFPSSPSPTTVKVGVGPDAVLYSGINRYVFSGTTGLCKEIHVERIEPKISKSKIEWKWRLACE